MSRAFAGKNWLANVGPTETCFPGASLGHDCAAYAYASELQDMQSLADHPVPAKYRQRDQVAPCQSVRDRCTLCQKRLPSTSASGPEHRIRDDTVTVAIADVLSFIFSNPLLAGRAKHDGRISNDLRSTHAAPIQGFRSQLAANTHTRYMKSSK